MNVIVATNKRQQSLEAPICGFGPCEWICQQNNAPLTTDIILWLPATDTLTSTRRYEDTNIKIVALLPRYPLVLYSSSKRLSLSSTSCNSHCCFHCWKYSWCGYCCFCYCDHLHCCCGLNRSRVRNSSKFIQLSGATITLIATIK